MANLEQRLAAHQLAGLDASIFVLVNNMLNFPEAVLEPTYLNYLAALT